MKPKYSYLEIKEYILQNKDFLISRDYQYQNGSSLLLIECGNCKIQYLQTFLNYVKGKRHRGCS